MPESKKRSDSSDRYTIGVMKTPVEGRTSREFGENIDAAVEILRQSLTEQIGLQIKVFEFVGPHLQPTSGTYSPFDFLRLGLTEKLERKIAFLLIVSEVDLAAPRLSYALAFPSRLMNIGILSTNRLSPAFWGEEPSSELTSQRLASLMLHTTGHILNLSHHSDPKNVMYDFESVEDLEHMQEMTPQQQEEIRRMVSIEARDAVQEDERFSFALRHIIGNWPAIVRAVVRANPFHLLTELPTMMTAAFSVIIVLFFGQEIWDVASTVELSQLIGFSFIALAGATIVLYRAVAFGAILTRSKHIAESTVVTTAATVLSLLTTMLLLYGLFWIISYLGAILIFPRRLMTTWPTVDPAIRVIDHIKLSMFLASVGLLTGSLGGRADSGPLVRYILFLDEET
jgi:predicted Zn-dependent protease